MKADGVPLPEAVAPLLSAHLASCGACRSLLGGELARSAMLRRALASPVRADSCAAIVAAARSPASGLGASTQTRSFPLWVPALGAAAAFAAVAWLAVYLPERKVEAPESVPTPAEIAAHASPSAPADYPLSVRYEEVLDREDQVPAVDGPPVRRETERVRRFLLPVGAPPRAESKPGVGWEQTRSRYIRMTSNKTFE